MSIVNLPWCFIGWKATDLKVHIEVYILCAFMSVVYSEGQLSALYETLSTLGDQRDEYKNAIVREETCYRLER